MVQQASPHSKPELLYPDSDGQPMAENTEHFEWIVTIKENLDIVFANDSAVFVAGDLLWYPVAGNNQLRQAPDVMVVFGRPKGYRGSYKQWEEDDLPPQVVFEIWLPGNRPSLMTQKFHFYDRYGVEEYYIYDPDKVDLTVWLRQGDRLMPIAIEQDWNSPRMGIRFVLTDAELSLYRPDGKPFLGFVELEQQAQQERQRAEQAEARVRELEERLRQLEE